mgnify:CR=1 FL=1
MKKLIVSLAVNGRENYVEKQKKLIETLPIAKDCDYWILNEYPDYVTPHSVTPYRFKFDLLKKAQELGYEQVFWMDSSMRILKDPFELLDKAAQGIVAFHNLGHPVKHYITDLAVKNTDATAFLDIIESTWGGCLGFDFRKALPRLMLKWTIYQSEIGTFDEGGSVRPEFKAARHDQSCLSVLFFQNEVLLLPYGVIAAKPHVTEETYIQYAD